MASGRFSTAPGNDDQRRRIVTLAALAPVAVVFPQSETEVGEHPLGNLPCVPDNGEARSEAPSADPAEGMDVGPSARNQYIVVHHTGTPNAHLDKTTNYCDAGYDFFIRADGEIVVCPRWSDRVGMHAKGCNCNTTGIMLTGCFGGCPTGNIERPTDSQECSLAHLMVQLGTPIQSARLVPHRYCSSWNPCRNPNPTATVCCGENLTTDDTATRWNGAGDAFVSRVIQKARNVKVGGCCFEHCPQPVLDGDDAHHRREGLLDAWSDQDRDLDYALYPLGSDRGYLAEVRLAGRLVERRAFTVSPDGVVATKTTDGPTDRNGPFGNRATSARGSTTARWVVAAAAVTVLLAAGALAVTRDRTPQTDGRSRVAVAGATAKASPPEPACEPPAFFPARLPWTDEVGQPDKTTTASDGSAELIWTAPQPGPSHRAPREVALVRRPHPVELGPEAATGTARGHSTRVVLVGDEGVGSVRMFWREADRRCESYELNVDRAISVREALTLLPR